MDTSVAVSRLIAEDFPASRFLGGDEALALLGRLAGLGIAGDAVYDALVGGAAAQHARPLATRDLRAVETYRALGVEVEILR